MVPLERVQQQTVEQIADAPQFREETVEVERFVPRERVQQPIDEQIVEVPHSQITQHVAQRMSHIRRVFVEGSRAFEQECLLFSKKKKVLISPEFLLKFQRVCVWCSSSDCTRSAKKSLQKKCEHGKSGEALNHGEDCDQIPLSRSRSTRTRCMSTSRRFRESHIHGRGACMLRCNDKHLSFRLWKECGSPSRVD